MNFIKDELQMGEKNILVGHETIASTFEGKNPIGKKISLN
jgi:hypothetical protein